jgi:hypothetical protein
MRLLKVLTIISLCVQKLISFTERYGVSFAGPQKWKRCSGYTVDKVKAPCPFRVEITAETASLVHKQGVMVLKRKCFFCAKAEGRQYKVKLPNRTDANGVLLCGLAMKCEEPDLGNGIIGCNKHRGILSVYSGPFGWIF